MMKNNDDDDFDGVIMIMMMMMVYLCNQDIEMMIVILSCLLPLSVQYIACWIAVQACMHVMYDYIIDRDNITLPSHDRCAL